MKIAINARNPTQAARNHACHSEMCHGSVSSAAQNSCMNVQESYQPTDILVSFGEEIKDTDPQCGMTQNEQGVCPYLPWFCWFIKADHPFRVWWLPALPTVVDEKIKDNWHTSHLNLYHRCMLDFDQVSLARYPVSHVSNRAALVLVFGSCTSRFPGLKRFGCWCGPISMFNNISRARKRALDVPTRGEDYLQYYVVLQYTCSGFVTLLYGSLGQSYLFNAIIAKVQVLR